MFLSIEGSVNLIPRVIGNSADTESNTFFRSSDSR